MELGRQSKRGKRVMYCVSQGIMWQEFETHKAACAVPSFCMIHEIRKYDKWRP